MSEPIYSPGLEGVIAGETAISTITGGLHYRGYAIEELAQMSTFEEVAWLLLHGELPTATQLAGLQERLRAETHLPGPLIEFLRRIPPQASLMDVMRTAPARWPIGTPKPAITATTPISARPNAAPPSCR